MRCKYASHLYIAITFYCSVQNYVSVRAAEHPTQGTRESGSVVRAAAAPLVTADDVHDEDDYASHC